MIYHNGYVDIRENNQSLELLQTNALQLKQQSREGAESTGRLFLPIILSTVILEHRTISKMKQISPKIIRKISSIISVNIV
ncbi:MAG: hypothetical protein A2320_05900 [Pseudomonadales bacterium GWC2_63_15]|nr:MAG: hypothetical protein A2320_05900 [Pseudomonadales bacterium GWC2_63_15]